MAANSSRKPATKRKSTAGNRRSTTKKKQEDMGIKIGQEILFLFFLAFTILLFLCNFRVVGADGIKTSIIGKFGNVMREVMCGLFGLMAYVAPALLFISIIFRISNRGNPEATFKLIGGIIMFLTLTIISTLFYGIDSMGANISEYYKNSSSGKSGGVVGGVLTNGLHTAVGMAGTIVVVIILFICALVMLTERSFIRGVKKGSQHVYETAKDDKARRKQQAQIRREEYMEEKKRQEEEESLKRSGKKVTGVVMDTKIPERKQEKGNIHEITLPEEQLTIDSLDHIHISSVFEEANPKIQPAESIPIAEVHKEAVTEKPAPQKASVTKEAVTKESITKEELNISQDIKQTARPKKKYVFPPISKLKKGENASSKDSVRQLKETALHLQETLKTFGVNVTVTDISQGPAVTRYELQPEQGVKVSKIVNLADDIKLNLAATDIRIEAPIPGKAAVGIEVPNKENAAVAFRELIETKEFKEFPSNLAFAVGKDIAGKVIVTDIAKMPHLLIAGATGSGKSVCINTLIMSILYKAHPDDVKLIMIDPKVVELSVYNGIPHLMIPVVTDPKKAAAALHWGVSEMTERYKKFADLNVRDLKGYNKKVEKMETNDGEPLPEKLPQVVIIVDELADLMMVAANEVEESICRLAQLARAAGIHLIIATQRPSVDVITGLIKANMPSRIAFSVSSGIDSRTILDMNGAEKLLGKGDMLFYPQGLSKPSRVQGAFISDKEVSDVTDHLKEQVSEDAYNTEIEEKIESIGSTSGNGLGMSGNDTGSERDAYFVDAGNFIIEKEKASIGMLQRVFKIGFNRAARIMDQLADVGVVGEEEGTKPRKVLMSQEEFNQLIEEIL